MASRFTTALARWFTKEPAHERSTVYTATDTITGETGGPWVVVNNLGPDWPQASPIWGGGMAIPAAWRAATLIADMLGSVPWHAYRDYGGGPIQRLTPTPPLLEQPAPPDTRITTISSLVLDYLWHGNAVGIWAARNAEGYPTAVLPVSALDAFVRRDDRTGRVIYRIGQTEYGREDIFHVKGPTKPGDLRGIGVVEAHVRSITLAAEMTRQAGNVSRSGVPTGVITTTNPDIEETSLRDSKAAWLQAQRDRTIAALAPFTGFQPISWNPEEMQLLEARKFSITEWEQIFGLPPGWLGGMNSARQYSNIEQDAINLLKFTMGGHLGRFEQALTLAFPRGTTVKATLDWLLRTDTLSRYQAHKIGLEAGFLTTDEVRDLEDRPPLPLSATPPPPEENPDGQP